MILGNNNTSYAISFDPIHLVMYNDDKEVIFSKHGKLELTKIAYEPDQFNIVQNSMKINNSIYLVGNKNIHIFDLKTEIFEMCV